MADGVSGYYLAHPDEPSVHLTSDAVLTNEVLDALERLQPDVIIAPAGAANMGVGGDLLFSVDELVTLVRRAPGRVVLNHLEALNHCPTTCHGLRERMKDKKRWEAGLRRTPSCTLLSCCSATVVHAREERPPVG